jgi:hypothetical protein
MELNTFIEVQAFGDFGVKYTDCVMVHSDKMDRNEILKEFYQTQGITSNTELDYRQLYNITQDFISFLEIKGFKRLKTQSVYFCD